MKSLIVLFLVGIILFQSGCASVLVFHNSQKELKARKAPADFFATLSEHPWQQIAAFVVDLGMGYGVAEGMRGLTGNEDETQSESKTQIKAMGDNVIIGNNNTINNAPAEEE